MKPLIFHSGHSGTAWFRLLWPAQLLETEVVDTGEIMNLAPDVVIVHNPIDQRMASRLAWLQQTGKKICIGIDDDFTCLPYGFPIWATAHPKYPSPTDWRVLNHVARFADRVIVTSDALAERYGGRDVRIIPNYLPDFYYDLKGPGIPEQWGVGWTGNIDQHVGDPDVINGALSNFPLRLIGAVNKQLEIKTAKKFGVKEFAEVKGWMDLDGPLQSAMAEFKVGLVPLCDNKFNRSKSFLKGLEFSALGVPFVATPMPEYDKLQAGLRATKPKDWKRQVSILMSDEEAWHAHRVRGLEEANRFKLTKHIEEWRSAWYDWG